MNFEVQSNCKLPKKKKKKFLLFFQKIKILKNFKIIKKIKKNFKYYLFNG